jgi:type I restriction enzyme S subunit
VGQKVRDTAQILPNREYELWSVPSFSNGEPEVAVGTSIGSAKLHIRSGDVLICKINPRINRVWQVTDAAEGREQIASTEWLVFRLKQDTALIPEWVVHFARSPRFREWIESEVSGATGSHTRANADGILQQEIPFPPITEQRRIVAILDEAFEAIATAKANTEKNLQNARELFDSQLRTMLGHQPDWPRKTLREVSVDFGRGKSKHRPRNDPVLYGGPYPFIQTGDVRGADHLITEYSQTYSEVGLAQSKLWPKGTLCITIAANIAETGVLNFEACFPDSIIGVVVDERQISSKFLEYLLQTVKTDLKAKGKGSAQDNINLATFENERFPCPPLDVQRRVVERLDALADVVERAEDLAIAKLAALDELKQSLLHQAFSGQLTARQADRTVAADV